jgi:hypothetical protein
MNWRLRKIGTGSAILLMSISIGQAVPKSGTVTVSVGDVKAKPAGGGAVNVLQVDDTVSVGDTVTTGANSRTVIVMTSQSAVRISENSEAVIEEIQESDTAPKVLVNLRACPANS